jgi:hypothetical protein
MLRYVANNTKLGPDNLISSGYDRSLPLPTTSQPINLLSQWRTNNSWNGTIFACYCTAVHFFKMLWISNESMDFLPFISPFGLTITPALSVEGKLCS